MNFEVVIIGSNSAVQAFGRHPTCQVFYCNHQPYLIDCGEGSQFRMDFFKIKKSKISQIFISHLHGDHYYGLIGFIASLNLNGRKDLLSIFGPEGIKEILEINFKYSNTTLKFPLEVHIIDATKYQCIFEDHLVEVFSIPLVHKIPTTGFLFKEKKRAYNIISEKISKYQIPQNKIIEIKNGSDFTTASGMVIPNQELTKELPKGRSYAYCSDTLYTESIIPYLNEVDLLYHESTFLESESGRAKDYFHATAKEAGLIAQKAGVQQLLLGHYSSRYDNLDMILEEAKTVFENTQLAIEGETFSVALQR